MGRFSFIIIIGLTLSGCATTATEPVAKSPNMPAIDFRGQGADPLQVAHNLMAANQPELALRAYYRAAATRGATADVLTGIGSANLRMGRLGQAERILRQAIVADPEFAPAWNNLGVVLMEKGDIGEAKEMFRRAYALDSGESDSIRANLRTAIAQTENFGYYEETTSSYELISTSSNTYKLTNTQFP